MVYRCVTEVYRKISSRYSRTCTVFTSTLYTLDIEERVLVSSTGHLSFSISGANVLKKKVNRKRTNPFQRYKDESSSGQRLFSWKGSLILGPESKCPPYLLDGER